MSWGVRVEKSCPNLPRKIVTWGCEGGGALLVQPWAVGQLAQSEARYDGCWESRNKKATRHIWVHIWAGRQFRIKVGTLVRTLGGTARYEKDETKYSCVCVGVGHIGTYVGLCMARERIFWHQYYAHCSDRYCVLTTAHMSGAYSVCMSCTLQ